MRLLIADDDATSRLLLSRLTMRWGYEPVMATDGEEAWEILQQPDPPRLLLLDWLMPGMDGLEICRRLTSQEAGFFYTLLLTSLTGQESLDEAFDAGAYDFLSKPVRPGELERRLAVGRRIIRYDEELARQQAERERLEIRLRQGQKLEAVGRLAAGVAHEINTPAQYVGDSLYFLEVACRDLWSLLHTQHELLASLQPPLPEPMAARLRRAEEEADLSFLEQAMPDAHERARAGIERVTEIVRAMKVFAHPAQEEQVLADLNQAVHNALVVATNDYRYVADARLEAGELPPVPCFPSELGQVLLNLIANATDAIQDRVGSSGERGEIVCRTWVDVPWAVLSVSDTGGGIPEAIADRIFDPFFTTKQVGRGSGLGLAFAHHIIASKHRGRLSFDSTPGEGTTFFVHLPLEPETEIK